MWPKLVHFSWPFLAQFILPWTANYFLKKYNEKYHVSKRFSSDLYRFFNDYPWVGNIRELENLIERVVVSCDNADITSEDLPEELRMRVSISVQVAERRKEQTYQEARDTFEREFLRRAAEKYKSSRKIAKNMELDHSTIVKKAAKYGIELLPRSRGDRVI